MKKIFGLFICLFIITGCGNSLEDRAHDAFARAWNGSEEAGTLVIDVDGGISIEESPFIEETISGDLTIRYFFDDVTEIMRLETSISGFGEDSENEVAYFAGVDMFTYYDGEWYVMRSDMNMNEMWLALSALEEHDSISARDVEILFELFSNVEYSETNRDGQDGYFIEAEMDLEQLLELTSEVDTVDANTQQELEQIAMLITNFDFKYSIFLPHAEEIPATHYITFEMMIFGAPIIIGPLEIVVQRTDESITLPEAARDAERLDFGSLFDF
jgi:hypothetical protein